MNSTREPVTRRIGPVLLVVAISAVTSNLGATEPDEAGPQAAPSRTPDPPAPAQITEPKLDVLLKYQELVTRERGSLEAQADRQFNALERLLNRAITILSVLLVTVGGVAAWLFGRTRKELQASIREMFETHATAVIEAEVRDLRRMIAEVKAEYRQLTQFQEKSVTWVIPHGGAEIETELRGFGSAGIHRIQVVRPDVNGPFDLGSPALVVLSFSGNAESRRLLRDAIERLRETSPPIVLLIYTYRPDGEQVRLDSEDQQVLARYPWHLPVNYPVRLLAEAQTLLKGVPWGGPDVDR